MRSVSKNHLQFTPPWHLRLIYFTQFQDGTYYKTRLILWAIICPLNFQNWLGQNYRGQGIDRTVWRVKEPIWLQPIYAKVPNVKVLNVKFHCAKVPSEDSSTGI